VEGDGVEAAVFGEAGELDADDLCVAPSHAELDGEGNGDGGADGFEDGFDEREIAQQAGASVATDDALGGAAEIEIDEVEAVVFDDAGGFCEGGGVGSEELGGDGVLVVVVGEVTLALGFACAERPSAEVNSVMMRPQPDCWLVVVASTFGTHVSEARRGAPASVVGEKRAGVFDEAAEDGVCDAGHGREDGGGRDADTADGEAGGDARVLGHRVIGGPRPSASARGVALLHGD